MEKLQSSVTFIILCWSNNKTMFFYLKQYLPLSMQFVLWYTSLSTALLQNHLSLWLFHCKKIKLDPGPCHVSFLFKATKIFLSLGDICLKPFQLNTTSVMLISILGELKLSITICTLGESNHFIKKKIQHISLRDGLK